MQQPHIKGIPEKSCTLSISPLLRESIIALSSVDQHYEAEGRTARLVDVLIDELTAMPAEHFDFPIPSEPRLHKIAKEMYGDLGYESVSAFISFFKKTLGRSPKQYMKIK